MVNFWKEDFIVQGKPSGNALLKVLIRESILDTNETTTMIRNHLATLDTKISEFGNDITKFNAYVQGLLQSLNERGKTTQDLLVNVAKGYMSCSDKNFTRYIDTLVTRDEDDPASNLTASQLMVHAANKYKNLKQKVLWEQPTEVEKELLVMKAKLTQLENKEK